MGRSTFILVGAVKVSLSARCYLDYSVGVETSYSKMRTSAGVASNLYFRRDSEPFSVSSINMAYRPPDSFERSQGASHELTSCSVGEVRWLNVDTPLFMREGSLCRNGLTSWASSLSIFRLRGE